MCVCVYIYMYIYMYSFKIIMIKEMICEVSIKFTTDIILCYNTLTYSAIKNSTFFV